MADSMQPKRLNINNNIDQSKTVLDSNETTSPGHLDIFSNITYCTHSHTVCLYTQEG